MARAHRSPLQVTAFRVAKLTSLRCSLVFERLASAHCWLATDRTHPPSGVCASKGPGDNRRPSLAAPPPLPLRARAMKCSTRRATGRSGPLVGEGRSCPGSPSPGCARFRRSPRMRRRSPRSISRDRSLAKVPFLFLRCPLDRMTLTAARGFVPRRPEKHWMGGSRGLFKRGKSIDLGRGRSRQSPLGKS